MTDPRIAQLVEIIDRAFDRKSWHGTNLRGSLRGLGPELALWRPGPERHNIWELTLHAAYWKYTVRRRILGEKRGSFPLAGSNWFTPEESSAAAWQGAVALLIDTHRTLRQAIVDLSPPRLDRPAPGGRTTLFELISGVAAHDLYHAGQIQLIKRLERGKRA